MASKPHGTALSDLGDQQTWQVLEDHQKKADEHWPSCIRGLITPPKTRIAPGPRPAGARAAEAIGNTSNSLQKPLDEEEFNRLQRRLSDWRFHGHHTLHKSWQFPSCQEALQWHHEALDLSRRHGHPCIFDLGHVSSGRIDTDILNTEAGLLSRDDLALAVQLNTLAGGCREHQPRRERPPTAFAGF